MLDNDDELRGYVLTRRKALKLLGASGFATLAACGGASALLVLTFNVSRVASNACAALSGAIVDVWHCDAAGVYSDVSDTGFRTVGQKFLRGYQATDSNGAASFTTIFPGWYSGRAVHIHYKIRPDAASSSGYEFTSQLFSTTRSSTRSTRNSLTPPKAHATCATQPTRSTTRVALRC